MKSQLNLLNQLQELVLTRDEHHQTGDGSHMDVLDASIDALVDKLEPQPFICASTRRTTGCWRRRSMDAARSAG